jgi:hypothetical protein
MNKIFPFVLIFAIFYNLMGFHLTFEIQQCLIKEEIKEELVGNLPDQALTLIKISSGETSKIDWTEGGKEFRYNGQMFDIVKIKIGSDTTYYYCFNDEKESNLLATLDKLVKDQTDNSQSRMNQKKHEITYFFPEGSFIQSLTEKPIVYFNYFPIYYSFVSSVLSPPPKITTRA